MVKPQIPTMPMVKVRDLTRALAAFIVLKEARAWQ